MRHCVITIGMLFGVILSLFSQYEVKEVWTYAVPDLTILAQGEDGSIYSAGRISSGSDFMKDELELLGGKDILVVKLSQDLQVHWAKVFGSDRTFEGGEAITVDAYGNSYITGAFTDTAYFDDFQLIQMDHPDGHAVETFFTAKLDPDGNVLWADAITAPTNYGGIGLGIAIDPQENIYSVGKIGGDDLYDDFGNLIGGIAIVKYTAEGERLWFRRIGSDIGAEANDIVIDKESRVFITGMFSSRFYLPEDTVTSSGLTPFISRLSPEDGEILWFRAPKPYTYGYGTALGVHPQGGVVATGYANGGISFENELFIDSAGDNDVYVVHYNEEGERQWAKLYGGEDRDRAFDLGITSKGDIIIGGKFQNAIRFGDIELTSIAEWDAFLLQLDSQGEPLWAQNYGSDYTGVGTTEEQINALFIDEEDNISMTGWTQSGTVYFDDIVSQRDRAGFFVAKLSPKTTSIHQPSSLLEINLHPNPTSSYLQLSFPSSVQGEVNLQLINTHGQIVLEQMVKNGESLDILHLPAGVYIAQIKAGDRVLVTKRVVKL